MPRIRIATKKDDLTHKIEVFKKKDESDKVSLRIDSKTIILVNKDDPRLCKKSAKSKV
jgi:hypothetical protein